MNYKQKLGYMALGAGILALGIIIGQWVTPDIEAQSNGVFDKIQCRDIEVVDKDGETAIRLYTTKHGGDIRMDSKDGRLANMGIDETGGVFFLSGKGKGVDPSVALFTSEDSASISVQGRSLSEVSMYAGEGYGRIAVEVEGKGLNDGGSAAMAIASHGGVVAVSDKSGEAEMRTDEHGGVVAVFNNQSKIRAAMGVNAFGNGGSVHLGQKRLSPVRGG